MQFSPNQASEGIFGQEHVIVLYIHITLMPVIYKLHAISHESISIDSVFYTCIYLTYILLFGILTLLNTET